MLRVCGIVVLLCCGTCSAQVSLGDALDSPTLSWTSGGSSPWFTQATNTHDGIDAARSGPISDSTSSWVQVSVIGPGLLSFWWKVSSELDYDTLAFQVDGGEQANLSGETNWNQRTWNVASGSHSLRWVYTKDFSTSAGSDCGWLDQVSFSANQPFAPVITNQPASRTVGEGVDVVFTVGASGNPTPVYQWYFEGGPVASATNSVLTLLNVGTNHSGAYTVIVTNSQGSATSAPAVLTVTSLAQALDVSNLVWVTRGDVPWFAQTNIAHDLRSAAQSGHIGPNQESWMETVVSGPGTLSFWWLASSEAVYDTLQFLSNGVLVAFTSGTTNTWSKRACEIPPGATGLRWRYSKDGSFDHGQDAGWVDEVTFVPKVPSGLALALDATNILENSFVTLSVTFTNPDPTRAWSLNVCWGDSSNTSTSDLLSGFVGSAFSHRYLDDDPSGTATDTYTIKVTITNSVGGATALLPIQISNVPPTFGNLVYSTNVWPGEPITLSGAVQDPGGMDNLQLQVNWGDGTSEATSALASGTTNFTLSHSNGLIGTNLQISLTVFDDDLGTNELALSVCIRAAPAPARIVGYGSTGTGTRTFLMQGTPEAPYRLQASHDLNDWTTIALCPAGLDGFFSANDSGWVQGSVSFYRVIWTLGTD